VFIQAHLYVKVDQIQVGLGTAACLQGRPKSKPIPNYQ